MKKLVLLCLALLLCLPPRLAHAESSFQVELSNPDTFFEEHMEDATPFDQSETLDMGYRVSNARHLGKSGEDYWHVRFELVLSNKTYRTLENLEFTAHFPEKLQLLTPGGSWLVYPFRLNAKNPKDLSYMAEYEWTTLIDLISLGMTDGLTLDDFYSVLFEITWKGGSEILCVSPENRAAAAESDLLSPLADGCTLLDEETVAALNEAGVAARVRHYGE